MVMRTETEMQITLATLRDSFGVDVAPVLELHGQELAAWLERTEDEVFEREHAELRAQLAANKYRTRPADDGGFYFLSGAPTKPD